jgi:uncharacterized protein YidB (DUF937 family)
MGILDQVAGALAGGKGGGMNALLLQQVLGMLGKPGALDGLLSAFQKQGLGAVAQSWVSTGQNLPISAAQLQQVLGSGMLGELAAKTGMQAPDAASALSQLLPQVVDKLTPSGALPQSKDLGGLLASVGKLLG